MRLIGRSGARRLSTLLLATLLAFTLAAPAWAEQTSSDSQQVRESVVERPGTEQRDDVLGIAYSGPAFAYSRTIVHQVNVQVDASVAGSGPVSQSATNDAFVDQSATATSGDTSQDGGRARSGRAVAGTITLIQQANVQIVAGWVPDGGVTQTAANLANVDQTADATSGGATAAEDGYATSGDASALSRVVIKQRNLQLYRGTDREATGLVTQTATNRADIVQDTTARTGEARAEVGSRADTGDSTTTASGGLTQENGSTTAQW